uniref:Uncharacterized protein n=1 Tax=Arundo donax TaxID=35708 RepID=A0A0A9AXC1_ARUDO
MHNSSASRTLICPAGTGGWSSRSIFHGFISILS